MPSSDMNHELSHPETHKVVQDALQDRKRKLNHALDWQPDDNAALLKRQATGLNRDEFNPRSSPSNEQNSTVFRFLDLPKELRLLVYEQLTLKISHGNIERDMVSAGAAQSFSFALVTYSIPGILILATCRFINSEAEAIIERKKKELLAEPPRIWVPYRYKALLYVGAGPVVALVDYSRWLANDPGFTIADYKASMHRNVYPLLYHVRGVDKHQGWELAEEMLEEPAFRNFLTEN
ncbi:hypothetical protein N0V90_004549 [Kalmusia sp. IMI 367209]|nr:hypothetical protein N0V90_004549 [Kalmusia sp. IMI 367209]